MENINKNIKYDDIAFKYFRPRNEERIYASLNIVLPGIEFSLNDFPHSWENGIFSIFKSWSDSPDGEEVLSLRPSRLPSIGGEIIWRRSESDRIEREALDAVFLHLDLSRDMGSSLRSIENDISSFREEECVVCKDSILNIMFCSCSHISVCDKCDNINLIKCPVCRTPSEIKRKL